MVVIIHKSIQWHVPNTGTPSYLVSPKFQTNASSEGGGGYYNGDYFYVNWALDLPDSASEQIMLKSLLLFSWPCLGRAITFYTRKWSYTVIMLPVFPVFPG